MIKNPKVETWMVSLKAAYDAGYYRTEAAVGEQVPLPWQVTARTESVGWSARRRSPMHGERGSCPRCAEHRTNLQVAGELPAGRGWHALRRWWNWLCEGPGAHPG
jgi:hypothetical protein